MNRNGYFTVSAEFIFTDKEYAESISAAVGGNGTARTCKMYLLEGGKSFYKLYATGADRIIASRVGNEYVIKLNIRAVAYLLRYVFFQNSLEAASVFAYYSHFTVSDTDTGFDFQKIGSECCKR